MKIWLSKNSEVSIRQQLVAQIELGIASDDLKPGERLPSIRELARRFGVHQNTISAAYAELADAGLIEFRKGSGSFVKERSDDFVTPTIAAVVDDMLAAASARGFSPRHIYDEIGTRLNSNRKRKVFVIEPDEGLCEIIITEISQRMNTECVSITCDELLGWPASESLVVAMYDEKPKLERLLHEGRKCVFLRANSVSASLKGRTRPKEGDLLAVISGWQDFILFSQLYLTAARIDPESLMFRSTTETDWRRGIDSASILICDMASARLFPNDSRVIIFELLSEASIAELRAALTFDSDVSL